MVQVRNPHGGNEWTGKFNDNDEDNWNEHPATMEACGHTVGENEDGQFWMRMKDFARYFYSCSVNFQACVDQNGEPMPRFDEIEEGHEFTDVEIDVEGHERAVLQGWDANRLRPWIIVVEATLPNDRTASYEDWEPILLKAGYQCVYNDGLNRFYIEPSRDDLARAFSSPPNPFDNIRLSRHSALCQDVVGEYHAQILGQQEEVAALAAQVQAHEADIAALRYEGDLLTVERDELHKRVTALMASLSWRMTAPLRRALSAIRRVSGGQVGNMRADKIGPVNASMRNAEAPAELTPEARQWAERLRQARDEASE